MGLFRKSKFTEQQIAFACPAAGGERTAVAEDVPKIDISILGGDGLPLEAALRRSDALRGSEAKRLRLISAVSWPGGSE